MLNCCARFWLVSSTAERCGFGAESGDGRFCFERLLTPFVSSVCSRFSSLSTMPPRKAASTKAASTKAASSASSKKAASTKAKPAPKAKATKRKRDDADKVEEDATEDAEADAPASPASAPSSPTAAADPLTADPSLLTLDALKPQLKAWGLASSGVKGDLIKRYRAFQKTG